MIRTLVFGSGRMAESLLALADEFPKIDFVAQVSRSAPANDRLTPPFFDTLENAEASLQRPIDLVIDFTLPAGTLEVARWCGEKKVALLSGVTGIDEKAEAALDEAAKAVPVLWAPNLSFGVNLMAELVSKIASATGPDTPVVIRDVHHSGKKDAPSGTALMLAQSMAGRGGRNGIAGSGTENSARNYPGVDFESRREGEVIGDHSVTFELGDETLELRHRAQDRRLFAQGALKAGQWLVAQPAGRYSASDWIRGS